MKHINFVHSHSHQEHKQTERWILLSIGLLITTTIFLYIIYKQKNRHVTLLLKHIKHLELIEKNYKTDLAQQEELERQELCLKERLAYIIHTKEKTNKAKEVLDMLYNMLQPPLILKKLILEKDDLSLIISAPQLHHLGNFIAKLKEEPLCKHIIIHAIEPAPQQIHGHLKIELLPH